MHTLTLIPLKSLGLLKFSGLDAAKFLQGQLTNDLKTLDETQSQLSAQCNLQGRVIANFHIFKHKDNYYLLLPYTLLNKAYESLKKYIVISKVEIQDVTNHWQIFGIIGELNSQPMPQEINQVVQTENEIIIRMKDDEPRFLVIATHSSTLLHDKQISDEENLWYLHEITAGVPIIYPETSEKFLPHRINFHLLNGISFNKGCYTGQEIIARIHYRGTLKHAMYYAELTTDTNLKIGQTLYSMNDQRECAEIVNCVKDSADIFHVLLIMQIADKEINQLQDEQKNLISVNAIKSFF